MIYLDNAATTLQKPKEVPEAVRWAMTHLASPGRGGYAAAMDAAAAVYRCRCLAADLFDAEPEQAVFTMNATHGLNVAIKTLVAPGDRVVVSGFEHNAVMRPLYGLHAQVVAAGRKLFDPADTAAAFERAVTADTAAVICTHVSNVFGYALPVAEIAEICRRRGVPLIVDASQSAGILPVTCRAWDAAFVAMPGHKSLYGPQGTGLLLCRRPIRPLLEGGTGSQSRLYAMPEELPDAGEAGTVNVSGICGLAAGLEFLNRRGLDAIRRQERRLVEQLSRELRPIFGIRQFPGGERQTGVLSLQLAGVDCEAAAQWLSDHGVAVRAGLHCAPLAHESAGTLEEGTVRLSVSCFNTPEEIHRAAVLLRRLEKSRAGKILGD